MTWRADFQVVPFNEHLGNDPGDLNAPGYFYRGDQSSVKNFLIGQDPVDAGFLMIQAYDVHEDSHRIRINGNDLAGFDIAREPGRWQTWMITVPSGNFRQGNNTVQVLRDTNTGDNFLIRDIVVNWRERVE